MSTLAYNGTTYELEPDVAGDLEARGVIFRDTSDGSDYRLSLEHSIDEIEDVATVATDAPKTPRLRTLDRNGGLFRAPWLPRRLDILRDDDERR